MLTPSEQQKLMGIFQILKPPIVIKLLEDNLMELSVSGHHPVTMPRRMFREMDAFDILDKIGVSEDERKYSRPE